jgi:CheY-like chemotaxis protein
MGHAAGLLREAEEMMTTNPMLESADLRVLVVDDDAALRRMLNMVLADAGWDVLEAKDGLEAVAVLYSCPYRLVVLLDWKMPEMSGEEVLELVRANPELASRHAYVLITANAAAVTPQLTELLRELCVPVVAKPFSLLDLLDTVEHQASRIGAERAVS